MRNERGNYVKLDKKKIAAYLGVVKIKKNTQENRLAKYHNPLSQSQFENHYGAYGGVLGGGAFCKNIF